MSIILNEREWAENAIRDKCLGRYPLETLSRVARYYHQCESYSKQDVRDKLEDFLLRCEPDVVLVRWSDALDRIAKSADRYPIVEVDSIDVTESEVRTIRSINGVIQQRVAFTLLCMAKYWNAAQPRNNNWVNGTDREIMEMANTTLSVRKQSLLFHGMKEAGLISFSKRVDNLNIMVNYIDNDSPVVIRVSDFRNLGNQWMMYRGGAFLQCMHCGLTIKRRSNSQKYCAECATEKYIRDSLESSRRRYSQLHIPPS